MGTPPPSVPPKKTLPTSVALPAVRPSEQQTAPQPDAKRLRPDPGHQQSNGSPLDNVIASLSTWRSSQNLHQPLQLPIARPSLQSDTAVSSGQPPTVTTSTKPSDHPPDPERRSIERQPSTASALPKEGRRVWNRRLLEQNGASQTLLKALDAFITNVPNIPTHMDPSRKIYVRNMRGWIMHLGLPVHDAIWEALINVLRTDTSLTAIGIHWDHDLCRYILGKIVLENQTKQQHQNQPKQTRQAINNAIKRELTCPTESGNSSRGKTFRDLFREKCKEGGVMLPVIEHTARTRRVPDASEKSASQAETTALTSTDIAPTQTRATTAAGEESYVSLPLPNTAGKPAPHGAVDDTELSMLRAQCAETDEWNRTAWWRLTIDEDVKRIPLLLAYSNLYELRALLTDFRWIARTFRCVDFSKGMRQIPTDGYDVMLKYAQRPDAELSPVDIEGFRLIRNAIMVILPILSKENASDHADPTFIAHLATQLVGRLLDLKRRFPNIACLIQSTEEHAPRPWLRPLTRCFHQPRTDIKLAVPSNGIFTPHLIVLSEDGTLLATSGTSIVPVKKEPSLANTAQRPTNAKDAMGAQQMQTRKRPSVIIWDVQSGKCVCKGPEIRKLVRHLSLSRDNNYIIGETVEGLFFWQLDKTKEMWTISSEVPATPRIKSVSSITAAVGSPRVLTTHRLPQEPMIVLWNTETGQKLDCFDRVKSNANCVDVSARGDYFASGHENGFIHLWTMREKVPVLSFKNEGADRGPQQVVALADVNRTVATQYPTISISFYEKGEERWLTAVSANHVIRVWLLPPRHISHDQWKSFVSSRRTAVLRCPRIRDVQWSQNGNFFTGGEDGIARMWRKLESGKWEWYAIDKENGERSSDVSTVLLSCGKRSQLVATYVTKSPYVTVWDMSSAGRDMKIRKRGSLYRAYLPMIASSIDATDIQHLAALDRMMEPRQNEPPVKDSKWMSTYGDNIGLIRAELAKFFVNLDMKSSTKPIGEMQPWLLMQPGGGASGMEGPERKVLRVCFEQPVITGQSGVFKGDNEKKDTSIGDMVVIGTDGGGWEREQETERRGMVAALQDGTIGMFELEGVKYGNEGLERKKEVELLEDKVVRSGVVDVAAQNVECGSRVRERSGMETLKLPESRYREEGGIHLDEDGGGATEGDGMDRM